MNTDILNLLFDADTFVQTNAYVSAPLYEQNTNSERFIGDGVLTGYGSVSGRAVFAAIQDESVLKGSVGSAHARKISECIDMAVKVGAPFVFIIDSAGARLKEGIAALGGYGRIMKSFSAAIGAVPTIAFINGQCSGAASIIASMADFTVMPDKGAVFSVTGSDAAGDKAGSADSVSASGVLSCRGKDIQECANAVKELIDYLPDNALCGAPEIEAEEDISSLIDTNGFGTFDEYDVRSLISRLADGGKWTELYSGFAESAVCGIMRIGGKTACLLANQPSVQNGVIDSDACSKFSGMLAFCDKFNIPVITLTNTCGLAASLSEENKGLSASAALLVSSFANSSVPKINVITGKAYGSAYLIMNGKNTGADIVYAWKDADISVITPEAGALILYDDEIKASDDPISARKDAILKYRSEYSTPVYAASEGLVDDIIMPSETRARIISALYLLS